MAGMFDEATSMEEVHKPTFYHKEKR